MKTSNYLLAALCLCMILFSSLTIHRPMAESLAGAWGYGPDTKRTVMVATPTVFSVATYDLPGRKFISSYGGTWKVSGNKLVTKIEWDSADSTRVGSEVSQDIELKGNKLTVKQSKESWDKLENGEKSDLSGAWIITGNYVDNKAQKRGQPFYPRRTMKVISGKHFQWIAYNVQRKQFINAGGGTYVSSPGKYTETVDFFTKTSESVGKTLPFTYSFDNGDWRHQGQKSTGGAMDECWTRRETLEN